MAVDETIKRPKSMSVSSASMNNKTNKDSPAPVRMGHLLARKHRIERWAYKGRSSSISDTATTSSAALKTDSAQKRSESSYSQAGRVLNIQLLQLSEQRQKIIERRNFDQKLFANKQALKHKDNQAVLKTLNYVRKCCKYADTNDDEEDSIDPTIFLEENSTVKRSRSRSPSATPPTVKRNLSANARTQTSASLTETFIKHNRKHIGSYASSPITRKIMENKSNSSTPTVTMHSDTPVDDDAQKRHVQFRINPDGTHIASQSAHVISNSHSYNAEKQAIRNVSSANGLRSSNSSHDTRTSNSAPLVRTISSAMDRTDEQEIKHSEPKIKRTLSRINSAKNALQEFRLHPERFLSASNRYLPLLRRQAIEVETRELYIKQQREKIEFLKKQRMNFSPPISRLSDGSDLTYDDAKSFLSEENDIGKYTARSQPPPIWTEQDRKATKKSRPSSKIDLMETVADDTSERKLALARFRDREYAHLQELIQSNPIEQILEPFSAQKIDKTDQSNFEQQKFSAYKRHSMTSSIEESSTKTRQLGDILRSIDSLRCSDTIDRRARRQVDIEKNRAKLGILIF